MSVVTEKIIFWLILDPITFGLGSIGAYRIFEEFVEHESFPNKIEWLPLIKKHGFDIIALSVAFGYFFYRLFYVLGNS